MTRSEIQQAFVRRFCPARPEVPVFASDLDQAEERLGVLFPIAYREFATTYGVVSAPILLDLIVKNEASLWDIRSFFSASECADTTEMCRSGGMSARLVAFASDSMGNIFCFDQGDLLNERPDDAPVWFFDHEFCEDSRLSESFDSWLKAYLALP
jgi:hypothetical protein